MHLSAIDNCWAILFFTHPIDMRIFSWNPCREKCSLPYRTFLALEPYINVSDQHKICRYLLFADLKLRNARSGPISRRILKWNLVSCLLNCPTQSLFNYLSWRDLNKDSRKILWRNKNFMVRSLIKQMSFKKTGRKPKCWDKCLDINT